MRSGSIVGSDSAKAANSFFTAQWSRVAYITKTIRIMNLGMIK